MLSLLFSTVLVIFQCVDGNKSLYHSFHGNVLTCKQLKDYNLGNTPNTSPCVTQVEACVPNEGRRVDGSCNNIKLPPRGTGNTPFLRLLPPVYDKDYEPRKAKSGHDLPSIRRLRTNFLAEGRVPSQEFTQLVTYYFLFMSLDTLSVQDTANFITNITHCCQPEGRNDRMCTPIRIPDDDPVLRYSDIRCLNLTRPMSYQSQGCIRDHIPPERISPATPALDLSNLYGNNDFILNSGGRKHIGGLLNQEEENGKIWPPSTKSENNMCVNNKKPHETRCHFHVIEESNILIGLNLITIWFWRHHNLIAKRLAEINPCWDDNRLFYRARDINIAIANNIFFYELAAQLMGRQNLINDNIISVSNQFRELYNDTRFPQIYSEYPLALRWLHTMQAGTVRMFDNKGNYLNEMPIVNLTVRTGFLGVGNNIDYITQGAFRQSSAKIDYLVDPILSENAVGLAQRVSDVTSSDLAKNRLFGFQPYIKYLELCQGRPINNFEDLVKFIEPERIELLQELYENVEDIDLLAGIWNERLIKGGHVPITFYCLVTKQMMHFTTSDRHWFERTERPHAYNEHQMKEVKKASIARLICDVGDGVTEIQKHAFMKAGHDNKIVSCDAIEKIYLEAWKDDECRAT